MIRTFYPFNAMSGMGHILALVFQFWYLTIAMSLSNSLDVLFCSWLLYCCEQIQHLKAIMKPLMELSATLDTVVPNSGELFKVGSKCVLCPYRTKRALNASSMSTGRKRRSPAGPGHPTQQQRGRSHRHRRPGHLQQQTGLHRDFQAHRGHDLQRGCRPERVVQKAGGPRQKRHQVLGGKT